MVSNEGDTEQKNLKIEPNTSFGPTYHQSEVASQPTELKESEKVELVSYTSPPAPKEETKQEVTDAQSSKNDQPSVTSPKQEEEVAK